MSPKFQSKVESVQGVATAVLSGVLDEDNELHLITGRIGPGQLVVNLEEIERINAAGVREWLDWISTVERRGVTVLLDRCSPAVVAQLNLVNNFTGQGRVRSFYAPYFCPRCDRADRRLIQATELVDLQPLVAPVHPCSRCEQPMDFDDVEPAYFSFLAAPRKVASADWSGNNVPPSPIAPLRNTGSQPAIRPLDPREWERTDPDVGKEIAKTTRAATWIVGVIVLAVIGLIGFLALR